MGQHFNFDGSRQRFPIASYFGKERVACRERLPADTVEIVAGNGLPEDLQKIGMIICQPGFFERDKMISQRTDFCPDGRRQ